MKKKNLYILIKGALPRKYIYSQYPIIGCPGRAQFFTKYGERDKISRAPSLLGNPSARSYETARPF
jgi:hypothetical protein